MGNKVDSWKREIKWIFFKTAHKVDFSRKTNMNMYIYRITTWSVIWWLWFGQISVELVFDTKLNIQDA